jgi:broad specificity phosphatase PhoE
MSPACCGAAGPAAPDNGRWAGTSRESVAARWGSVDRAPGVEPPVVVRDRSVEGLTDIACRARGGMVAVVSHDAVNRQVLVAFDADLGDPDAPAQENGCFNTLEWQEDGWTVPRVNEIPAEPRPPIPPGRQTTGDR